MTEAKEVNGGRWAGLVYPDDAGVVTSLVGVSSSSMFLEAPPAGEVDRCVQTETDETAVSESTCRAFRGANVPMYA